MHFVMNETTFFLLTVVEEACDGYQRFPGKTQCSNERERFVIRLMDDANLIMKLVSRRL